jgi:2-hydroxychromene-2-carboxylate isomerase
MKHIDFFYFFGSGYAYLSVMRIEELARQAGVSVRWRPFNVRTVMAENNIALRTQAAKVKYMWRDIERRAASQGVPFLKAPIWPTDPDLLANRIGVLAAEEGWCEAYTKASFRAWYLKGLALGERACLEYVLRPLGKDVDAVIKKAESARIEESLKAETDVARSFGIFGSPSFVVEGEMFWGDDRLEEALAWASHTHRLKDATAPIG